MSLDACEAVEVVPAGPLRGAIAAPASKSVTNRLLVIAALADGMSVLHKPLDSDDAQAMRAAVSAFGAHVAGTASWQVQGTGGELQTPSTPVDARLSGTTLRFATALAALAPDGATVTGAPALLRRPVGPLVDALATLGARGRAHGDLPPVRMSGGGLEGGDVRVDIGRSTQFATAVLLVAPYARADVRLHLAGTGARDYIRLTSALMRAWGADVGGQDDVIVVRAGAGYDAQDWDVEYDASAACHLFALAAATRGMVTVTNATPTVQPDAALIDVLTRLGSQVERVGHAVTVRGPNELTPVDVDLSGMPDQVTTVAVLAALAPGTSRIRNVAVTRTHETDRLAALARELGKLGVRVDEEPGGLVIHGGSASGPARLATYEDHRLAMAFAALAARVPGVVIEDPGCVSKTYPRFWADAARLGLAWKGQR